MADEGMIQRERREWFRNGVSVGLGGAAVMVEQARNLREAIDAIRKYQNDLERGIENPGYREMESGDIMLECPLMHADDIMGAP